MCCRCRSSPKYRAIAWAVEKATSRSLVELANTPGRGIFELSTTSGIHRTLRGRRGYVASGYFPDQSMNVELRPGVWNADVQALPFESEAFDVVISSETFEHVRHPELGFQEIHRVLRPGGLHCFTIPFNPKSPTIRRVDTSGREDVDILPRLYHLDPYCPKGALVYTDFGWDLPKVLAECGFATEQNLIWDPDLDIRDDLGPVRVFQSVKTLGFCSI